jgi:hypothetical protein
MDHIDLPLFSYAQQASIPIDVPEGIYDLGFNGPKSLYFITSPEAKALKIGIATNPHKRMYDMQVANPTELILHVVIRRASQYEKILHNILTARGFHLRGEWFSIEALTPAWEMMQSFSAVNHTISAHL